MVSYKVNKESAMSEPVSNAEIEDVLSSIRRLVSENAGTARRDAAGQDAPEKLVLTPAFRVDDGEQEEETGATLPRDGEVVTFEAGGWSDGGPEAVEEMVAATVDDWAGLQVEDPAQEAEESVESSQMSDPTPPPAQMDDTSSKSELERRIAELEAVIARSAAEFEPDGSEDLSEPEAVMFQHSHEPEDAAVVLDGENADSSGELSAEASTAQESVAEEMAPQEEIGPDAALASGAPIEPETTPDHEEQASDPPDIAEPAVALAYDDAEDADSSDQVADAWEDVEGDEIGADEDDADEALLDEEALREMVARMVREELQGSVGERITHNVRRMVRREIARALALQDFE